MHQPVARNGCDARDYLAEVGFKALPGFVRDLKDYEVALLQGKAITETGQKRSMKPLYS